MYDVEVSRRESGFSLTEVLIALAMTTVMLSSVMALLHKGQRAFAREPEVADVIANSRAGLFQVATDLTMAGFSTPPNLAVMWNDGGAEPDELSIVFADVEVPISRPKPCSNGSGGSSGGNGHNDRKGSGNGGSSTGGGPCNTIGTSATLNLDPYSMSPMPLDFETAYREGMLLFAIQGPNGDPACDDAAPAIVPFIVTQPPKCTGAGGAGSGPAGCATLMLNHNPGKDTSGINPPGGFQNDVSADCAVIGRFHVVQYRVYPLPPADSPSLERRDLALGADWVPVAGNIENLQVQYAQGFTDDFRDEPHLPVSGDPATWVSQVRVTVSGRGASTHLEGAVTGAFDDGARLRRVFTTTMSLRNQLYHATEFVMDETWNAWD